MAGYCARCPYFGYCPGAFAAEANAEQRRVLASDGCPVRDIISHIIRRLERTPIAEQMSQQRLHFHPPNPDLVVEG